MQEILSYLNAMARNYVKPDAPLKMKKMAASAMFPLPPQQLVLVLYILAHDEHPEVAQTARKKFKTLPAQAFEKYLDKTHQTPPDFLDFVARHFLDNTEKIEAILLHPKTADETFAWLAAELKNSSLELIALNQQRQQRYPQILQNLLQNEALSSAHRARAIEFALRSNIETGLSLEELRPFVSPELLKELGLEEPPEEEEAEEKELDLPPELVEEEPEQSIVEQIKAAKQRQEEEKKDDKPAKKLTIEQQLASFTVSEKIKAALKGNKAVRTILLRDSNRLVCTAVMKNPRLTESEVISIAASRSVSDDVIREITRNREWMKLYSVKLNLVGNPKCPTPFALRLLNQLRTNDLKNLAKNKGIPGVVARAAHKLYKTRAN